MRRLLWLMIGTAWGLAAGAIGGVVAYRRLAGLVRRGGQAGLRRPGGRGVWRFVRDVREGMAEHAARHARYIDRRQPRAGNTLIGQQVPPGGGRAAGSDNQKDGR